VKRCPLRPNLSSRPTFSVEIHGSFEGMMASPGVSGVSISLHI
jgi:hypothetical protein